MTDLIRLRPGLFAALICAPLAITACDAGTQETAEETEVVDMGEGDGVPDTTDPLDMPDTAAADDDGMATTTTEIEADPLLLSLDGDVTAEFVNTGGETVGNVALTEGPNGVLLRVDLQGLTEGWHGIHLHQVGDCSDGDAGFQASGSHINPDGNSHGLLNAEGYERADMPNIHAGSDGRATAAFFNPQVQVFEGGDDSRTVLVDSDGFAIVVHENPDDHMTQPIGGAGSRVACAAFTD